jgi:hypothetical protein
MVDARDLYTRFLRRELVEVGFRREVVPPVVRYTGEESGHSMILFSECVEMEAAAIAAVARRERDHFQTLGHELEWKVFE